MSHTIKLLDKYAATCLHANDSDTARALRVTPQTVNNWRHGRSQPTAASVERMCETLGEPLREWLPLIEADRSRNPADRKVWLRLAQASATLAALYLVASGRIDVQSIGAAFFAPLYIMRTLAAVAILALAGYAASKIKEMTNNAGILERDELAPGRCRPHHAIGATHRA